jgi:hypothetical protein
MRNLNRKFLALIAGFVAFSLPSLAQNPAVFGGAANAWAFAYGVNPIVPALQVDVPAPISAGTATLSVAFGSVSLGDGTVITPLSTHAPITIGTGANKETVTPSAVSCGTPNVYQSCTFTATFSYAHGTGDRIASASYGIDEAGTYVSGKFGGGLVTVSPQLLQAAGVTYTHAGVNTFITGFNSVSATVAVLDYSGISSSTAGSTAHSYTNATVGSALTATNVIY